MEKILFIMSRDIYPPPSAKRAVRKLGSDIKGARLSRRLPASLLAERAGITRPTLTRVEQGVPSVSMGVYAAVLQSLGLLEGLSMSADISNDSVGRNLARDQLTISRAPKRKKKTTPVA